MQNNLSIPTDFGLIKKVANYFAFLKPLGQGNCAVVANTHEKMKTYTKDEVEALRSKIYKPEHCVDCRIAHLEKLAEGSSVRSEASSDPRDSDPRHFIFFNLNQKILRAAIKGNNIPFVQALHTIFPYHRFDISLHDNESEVNKKYLVVAEDIVLNMSKEMAQLLTESEKLEFHFLGSLTSDEIERKCKAWVPRPQYSSSGCELFLSHLAAWRQGSERFVSPRTRAAG